MCSSDLGTRDTGNINDDRDTGTQLQRGHRGKQGDVNDDRDREWSISNHHQQSSRAIIRIMRYRSEYRLFSHGPLYVACSRVGKSDNLFICTNNGTAKNIVYSQVLRSKKHIYMYIYLYSQVGHRDTTTMARKMTTTGTQGHNYKGDAGVHRGIYK